MGQRISFLLVVTMVSGLLLVPAVPAFSFVYESPFMYVEANDPLPALRFEDFATGEMTVFDGRQQRPLVLVFFGVDIDTKRERAIEVLAAIQERSAFYRQRNVKVAAVFVQPEQISHVDEVVAGAHIEIPVYVDRDNLSYEKLGVYVMPSLLVVRADGIIHKGLGYTHNLDEILPGEIAVMLHEKTREELSAELHPTIVERTTAQRRARLDYHYALYLVERQEDDLALEKLEMALEKDPDFVPALVEEGCLLVKKERFHDAEEFLERSLKLSPQSQRAMTCKLKLQAAANKQGLEEEPKPPAKLDPATWGFFAGDDDEEDEPVD